MDNREKIIELIRQYQGGNTDAFNEIYTGTYKLVYTVCYGILRSQEDAEDLTQDSFLTIYEKLSTLDVPETYPSWMSRIATNKALDYCRRTRRISYTDNDAELDVLADDWSEVDGLPDSFIEDEERRTIINNVLKDSLSEVQYQTIFLHYFNNLSVEDIAESMDCPEGTVKTRLKSARAKFKDALENYLSDNKLVLSATPFMTRFFTNQMSQIDVPVKPFVLPDQQSNNNPVIPAGTIAAVGKGASTGAKVGILSTLAGKIIVGAVVIAGGIALTFGGYKLLKKPEPAVINMNDYLKYSVVGSNNSGRIDYDIDYQAIVNNNPELTGVTVEQLQSMISGQWNKTESISNGDELVFTWAESDGIAAFEDEKNVDMVNTNITYSVTGLKQPEKIDPFQYVNVSFSGVNGNGKATLTVSDDIPVDGLTFLLSSENGLSNGQDLRVKMTAPNGQDAEKYLAEKGYSLSNNYGFYEVTGLTYEIEITDVFKADYKSASERKRLSQYGDNSGIFAIPQITISGVDTDSINEQIYSKLTSGELPEVPLTKKQYNKENEMGEQYYAYSNVEYSYYIGDKYVSIVIDCGNEVYSDENTYYVYNIDLATGDYSDSALLKSFDLTDDEFKELAKQTVKTVMDTCRKKSWGKALFPKEYYDYNLSDDNYEWMKPFVNSEGHLCFVFKEFCIASGMDVYTICFDTVTKLHCQTGNNGQNLSNWVEFKP